MGNEDFYRVLGVNRSASDKEIKQAYRQLARELHPDHNQGNKAAEERFKTVSAAYAVLGDKEKRKLYDRYGIDGLRDGFDPEMWQRYGGDFGGAGHAGGRAPRGTEFDFGGFSGFGSLEDIFESLFDGRGATYGKRRGTGGDRPFGKSPGAQVHTVMEIDLLDAVLGRQLQIVVPIEGERRKLKVKVPKGVEDGQTIRLKGQGGRGGRGAANGDLMLELKVKEHPRYTRTGDDLKVSEAITVGQAYHGTNLPIETPWGNVKVTIPKGTQGGQKLRVKGHGIRNSRRRGDLIVQVYIRLPKSREESVAKAIEELEQMYR